MGFLLAVVLAVLAGTAAQSAVGFGFALLVVPVLTVVAGPKVAVVTMTAIGLPMTVFNTVRWRAHLQRREAARVSAAALLGMPFGALLLTRADEAVLTAVVGIVVLALTGWLWRGLRLPPGGGTELTAGAVSGALATSVGTNGPPVVIAFQAAGMEPSAFRATLAATFAVQGAVALGSFWLEDLVTSQVGAALAVGLPAAVAGALLGDVLFERIGPGRFRAGVLVMLASSGAAALATAATR